MTEMNQVYETAKKVIKNNMPEKSWLIEDDGYERQIYPEWADVVCELADETEDEDYQYELFGRNYDDQHMQVCQMIVGQMIKSKWFDNLHQQAVLECKENYVDGIDRERYKKSHRPRL